MFSEFINIVSILFDNFIVFIILFHTFLVMFFARYRENIIFMISFSNFSDVLPALTCESAIGNLWSICFELKILWFDWSETLLQATRADILGTPSPWVVLYLASDKIEE